jgi:hypothetical protein
MRPSVAVALTTATATLVYSNLALAANNVHVALQTSFDSAPFLVELLSVSAYFLHSHYR